MIISSVKYLFTSLKYTEVIWRFLSEISEISKFTEFRAKISVCTEIKHGNSAYFVCCCVSRRTLYHMSHISSTQQLHHHTETIANSILIQIISLSNTSTNYNIHTFTNTIQLPYQLLTSNILTNIHNIS